MASRYSNKFAVRGSGSPNVITLMRPPPRSMPRSDAAQFAAWLATFGGDLDYFLKVLIDVWGSRYGAEQIPAWLWEAAGPWEAAEEAPVAMQAPPDPRANAGEARARKGQMGDAPRAISAPQIYQPRANQDSGPATRGPRPQPADPRIALTPGSGTAPAPIPSASAAAAGSAKGKSRIIIDGKPATRESIAKKAEEARSALMGEGMKAAPRSLDEEPRPEADVEPLTGSGSDPGSVEDSLADAEAVEAVEEELADAESLLQNLTTEEGLPPDGTERTP